LTVGELKPPAQLAGRFVRRLSVERHQRCRPAGPPGDLRAPLAEADAGDFNLVLAAVDDFFKTMHVVSRPAESEWVMSERGAIVATRYERSSERRIEDASTQCNASHLFSERRENSFPFTALPQRFHYPSTGFPQQAVASRSVAPRSGALRRAAVTLSPA
jgi:hypothetical protein